LKEKKKKTKLIIVAVLAAVVLIPVIVWLFQRWEGEKPQVQMMLSSPAVGLSTEFSVRVSDPDSGLRQVRVLMIKDGAESVLAQETFPSAGPFGGGEVGDRVVTVSVEPRQLGISDGAALIRVVADDYSWRRWWNGNRQVLDTPVTIDTRPPTLAAMSRAHNITQGGTGLVVYRIDEACPEHGVRVGDRFFPGYPAPSGEPGLYMAFFALAHDQGTDTSLVLEAADRAGNRGRTGFSHYIRKKRFPEDTIRISDRFLSMTLPKFDAAVPEEPGQSPLDRFLVINRELRKANYQRLVEICSRSDETMHWKGEFLRLPGSARQAAFADRRRYRYRGNTIDRQIHMGIDLASVSRSPVPAANAGRVIFAKNLGIYGQTVVIDHGFGIFSMYAHLSRIDVTPDHVVSKGDVIGLTGSTGLAGGDHLHFSMIVAHTFVNPVEWWDAEWIANNVTGKIGALPAGKKETVP